MAESSLSLGFPEFRVEVGDFLGHGRTPANWSAEETDRIDSAIHSGYRKFLHPPPLPGERVSHEWSFLKPVTTLTLTASDYDYTLPDDFGQMDGDFTFAPNDGALPIPTVPEVMIRDLRQRGETTGKPQFAAVRAKSSDGTTGQRFEAIFWPTPDAAYVLTYRRAVLTNALSASYPYPLGGMAHAETVLASILAVAEERWDNVRGPKQALWIEQLVASVERDRKFSPDFFGYNGDGSVMRGRGCFRESYNVTVNGVQY